MKSELVCKAMAILNAHDFYYVMSDSLSAENRAKESMKQFVAVTNRIGGQLREDLRNLWVATDVSMYESEIKNILSRLSY